MKAEHVELLRELLPEWEFFAPDGGLYSTLGFKDSYGVGGNVHIQAGLDHLTTEVERALLARKSERTAGPVQGIKYTLWAPCDYRDDEPVEVTLLGWGGENQWYSGRCKDKISALLEAYRQVQGG